jgi:hypothetical protein
MIEHVGVRLIEGVVILGSAAADRRHQRETDRGSLRIERVGVLTAWALLIEGVGMRLIEQVVILWPVAELVDLIRGRRHLGQRRCGSRHQHEADNAAADRRHRHEG